MNDTPSRPALRTRLLALFLIVVLVVIGAMFVAEWRPAGRKRQIAAEIGAMGGTVTYPGAVALEPTGVVRGWLTAVLGSQYFTEPDCIAFQPRSADDLLLIMPFKETRELRLQGSAVTDNFLLQLKELPGLNNLSLQQAQLGDASALLQLANLNVLHLIECDLSADALRTLKELPSLVSLSMEKCKVASGDWQALHGAKSNLTLDLTKQELSEAELLGIYKANTGWAIAFRGVGPMVGNSLNSLPCFKEISKPTFFNLGGPKVTEATLQTLKDAANVTSIHLGECAISDEGLKVLAQFPQLSDLQIYSMPITDAGLSNLQSIKTLKKLTLNQTKVQGETLDQLSKTIEELYLGPTPITNEAVTKIAQLPGLTILSIGGDQLSDACLDELLKLKSLKLLELWHTTISPAAAESFRQKRPGCVLMMYDKK